MSRAVILSTKANKEPIMTTSKTAIEIIQHEAELCLTEARKQGYDGADVDYHLTAEDCDYIADQVKVSCGRRPTKVEWDDAGHPVGGAHYDD